MKKILIIISFFIVLIVLAINFMSAPIVCLSAKLYNLEKVSDNILVTPSMGNEKKEKLIKLYSDSKDRIKNIFGDLKSVPLVIYFENSEFFLPFKINLFGQAPTIGANSCLIIGPKGQNIDVVAHEMMHAEVHYRIGALKMLTEVPAWFDEGLAMQVDFRENFNLSKDQLKIDPSFVRKLDSYYQFHKTKDSYPFAKSEVRKIVNRIGEKNIFNKLDAILNKDSFEETFLIFKD